MRLGSAIAGVVICLLIPCAVLEAGVVFEVETTYHSMSPPRSEVNVLAVAGSNLKMNISDSPSGQDGAAIYRGEQRELVIVDHGDRSYMVMDEEMMARIGGQVSAAMIQKEEAPKDLPADQRAEIEKVMKERMPGTESPGATSKRERSEVRKTSEHGQKNGYPCVKYDVLRGGRKTQELWVTAWSNVEGGLEVAGIFKEMAEFMSELMDSMPQTDNGMDSGFELLTQVDGFPVISRDFDDEGALESEAQLRSSQRRTLDPAEFEPPAGYKLRQMFP